MPKQHGDIEAVTCRNTLIANRLIAMIGTADIAPLIELNHIDCDTFRQGRKLIQNN